MDARRDKLQKLPIGIQDFVNLRQEGYLYVDKTQYLVDILDRGKVFFSLAPGALGNPSPFLRLMRCFPVKKNCLRGCMRRNF